jgi:protocatechuate 3,4-dioxygenase beta subunit
MRQDQRLGLRLAMGLVLAVGLGVPADYAEGSPPPQASVRCAATPGEAGDSSYRANAPVRSQVGTGFMLTGIVRSSIDCSVITRAHVEFWLAGPNGYDEAHRGTVITDGTGRYRFESNFPGGGGWRPHIHLRIAVPGFRTLVTVYFPRAGSAAGTFDLVLEPDV